jgi:hypothetical protein
MAFFNTTIVQLLAKALNLGENTTPCDATCEMGMKRIKGSFSHNIDGSENDN